MAKGCPKCGGKMESKRDVMRKLSNSIMWQGNCFTPAYYRIMEEWRFITARCLNPNCKFAVEATNVTHCPKT